MSCNSCNKPCNNSCGCGGTLPYYEEACFQENQNEGVQVFNQYSAVIRISTEWAVPLGESIVTLDVAALADILIGSAIWNPTYGAYNITDYLPDLGQIKVQKADNNIVTVGTVIPACSKFIVIQSGDTQQEFVDFESELTATTGSLGALDNIVVAYSKYLKIGQLVNISISADFDVITNTIVGVTMELPFTSGAEGDQIVPCRLKIGSTISVGLITILNGVAAAVVTKLDGATIAISSDDNFTCNFFYRGA